MKTLKTITIIIIVLFTVRPALADWDLGQPAKWVQLPDLESTGIDVNATLVYAVADDFLCTSVGPITDIHIWGSWLRDYLPSGDPNAVDFRLFIRSDIPAGPDQQFSMPGENLWDVSFPSGTFTAVSYAQVPNGEGWYDSPTTGEFISAADFEVWQYNFTIDPEVAFQQRGTPESPVVYWLQVLATPHDQQAHFGWKTSLDHWNDDAVWNVFGHTLYELSYPDNHRYAGQSMDMAFVITPEPATLAVLLIGGLALVRRRLT